MQRRVVVCPVVRRVLRYVVSDQGALHCVARVAKWMISTGAAGRYVSFEREWVVAGFSMLWYPALSSAPRASNCGKSWRCSPFRET